MAGLIYEVFEVQNPNNFLHYKLAQFIQKLDYPFVNFKLELKDEITNNLTEQYPYDSTGVYTKYSCTKNILKVLNSRIDTNYHNIK